MLSRRRKKNNINAAAATLEEMLDKDRRSDLLSRSSSPSSSSATSDSYEEFEYLRRDQASQQIKTSKASPAVTVAAMIDDECSRASSSTSVSSLTSGSGSAGAGGVAGGGAIVGSSSVTYSKCEKVKNNGKAVTMGVTSGAAGGGAAGSLRSRCSEQIKLSGVKVENLMGGGGGGPAVKEDDEDPDEIDGYCPVEVLKSEGSVIEGAGGGEKKTEMNIIR